MTNKKLVIPTILAATILVAGMFAFMPVQKASTVHTTLITEANLQTVNILASAARTATGAGSAVSTAAVHNPAIVKIDVTAVSGTSPTLVVTVRDAATDVAYGGGTSGTLTATGVTLLLLTSGPTASTEVAFTIGGTSPSFTFSVDIIG